MSNAQDMESCQACEEYIHLWNDDVIAVSRLPKGAKMSSSVYYFHAPCFENLAGDKHVPNKPKFIMKMENEA